MSGIRWRLAQKLEWIWWKIYLSDKNVQTYLDWKKAYWKNFLKKINIYPESGKKVLDAGCGPAGIFTVLSKQEVVAIDPLLEHYQSLNHFNKSEYQNVGFKKRTLEKLHLPDSFDYVFCLNVINHVDNIEVAIQNLVESLNTQGTLVVSVDVHRTDLIFKMFNLFPFDILHPYQMKLEGYIHLLQKSGMEIMHIEKLKQGLIFDYVFMIARKDGI